MFRDITVCHHGVGNIAEHSVSEDQVTLQVWMMSPQEVELQLLNFNAESSKIARSRDSRGHTVQAAVRLCSLGQGFFFCINTRQYSL